MGKIKCKTCGNLFDPKGPNDRYCSSLCRTAGCFIGGGGDTRKPNSEITVQKSLKQRRTVKTTKSEYPRVLAMMELPPKDRWMVSKDFTEEERVFARRLAKKSLLDERVIDCISDWNGGDEEDEDCIPHEYGESIGDSDDGSV